MLFGILAFSLPMGLGSLKVAPIWHKSAPKICPILPQEGRESAQERPKSGPGGSQYGLVEPPKGELNPFPPLLSHGVQDGPKRPLRPPERARMPQDGYKRAPRGPHKDFNGGPKRATRWLHGTSENLSQQHLNSPGHRFWKGWWGCAERQEFSPVGYGRGSNASDVRDREASGGFGRGG